jgi:hypothetical protein
MVAAICTLNLVSGKRMLSFAIKTSASDESGQRTDLCPEYRQTTQCVLRVYEKAIMDYNVLYYSLLGWQDDRGFGGAVDNGDSRPRILQLSKTGLSVQFSE